MLLSKCRSFIIFLTFCYIFDVDAGITNKELYDDVPRKFLSPIVDQLIAAGFSGNMNEDLKHAQTLEDEYETKEQQLSENELRNLTLEMVFFREYVSFLNNSPKPSSNYLWPYSRSVYSKSILLSQ